MKNWQDTIQLRLYQQTDLPFLAQLYASTRADELAQVPFSDEQKAAFLQQQFAAQLLHYTTYYNTDSFHIVELNGIAIGRLFVDHWERELRVVDISLLPDYQNKKIGSYLFQQLFAQSQQLQKAVSIHVEQHNPARTWYERLGFRYDSTTNEVYLLMKRQPNPV